MWCERHKCWKTRNWVKLCQTRADYRKAWDEGRGPGQKPAGVAGKPKVEAKPRVKGVGDHMKDVTAELKLVMKQGCGCASLAAEMNRLGAEGCRRDRARLVPKLQENAKRYSWGDVAKAAFSAMTTGLVWRLDLTDVYGSLLDEAIRRAEAV
jgi:hypothetical protein